MEHTTVRGWRTRKSAEVDTTGETEHGAASIARDRRYGRNHVAHARRVGRDEEHAQIVDAEMIVDHTRCDDLTIGADFRFDDARRGIICVERAKARTRSKRNPGNGGENVCMSRGSIGAPWRMSRTQAR
jgi:hypothetical protein